MNRIASFCVDHTKLEKGLYVSRIDGDVVTYDLRMCIPNAGSFLENGALHTIEHLFATYVRNSRWTDGIVYVGPMGCRTGFYFLTRDSIPKEEVISLLRETFRFIAGFEGEIPGSKRWECGNYLEHDLPGARTVAADMLAVLKDWNEGRMQYEQ